MTYGQSNIGASARSLAERGAEPSPDLLASADTETPKGTLSILLLYAGAIVLMWGYVYFTMLVRR